MTERVIYDIEYTDTFAGQANYCWVNRKTLEVDPETSDLALVRRAKAAMGLTGVRCITSNFGDMIEVRPRDMATVMFITYRDQ